MSGDLISAAQRGIESAYQQFSKTDGVEKATAVLAQHVGEMEDAQTFQSQVDPETAGDIIQARTKSMSELPKPTKAKEIDKAKEVVDKVVNPEEQLDREAKAFSQGKPEFDRESLKKLHDKINDDDTPESILAKVRDHFPKGTPASQIFDALAFLQLSIKDPSIKENVENAKNQFGEQNSEQIDNGREMTKLAHEAANAGLGTVKKLHGVFVDMVANENKTPDLYKQLCVQYPVYKDLLKMIKFVQSESGKDLHNRQIDNIYLGALNNTTKNLQSLVMVYRGFEKKMPQMDKQMQNAIEHFQELRSA